jgi:hypothetical protein
MEAQTLTVKAVLEVDFGRGKHGAIVCAGDVLGWLPPGVRVGRSEAEAIYHAYCRGKFRTLKQEECATLLSLLPKEPGQ